MNSLVVTAHIEPDTETRITAFGGDGQPDGEPFVSIRIGSGSVDIALLAAPGASQALRKVAAAAEEAARVLEGAVGDSPEVAV